MWPFPPWLNVQHRVQTAFLQQKHASPLPASKHYFHDDQKRLHHGHSLFHLIVGHILWFWLESLFENYRPGITFIKSIHPPPLFGCERQHSLFGMLEMGELQTKRNNLKINKTKLSHSMWDRKIHWKAVCSFVVEHLSGMHGTLGCKCREGSILETRKELGLLAEHVHSLGTIPSTT